MRAIVIGSAAGGGFPQWNCGCPNCAGVREGRKDLLARTQDSVAVTADGERFALVNASPDILADQATPRSGPRAASHADRRDRPDQRRHGSRARALLAARVAAARALRDAARVAGPRGEHPRAHAEAIRRTGHLPPPRARRGRGAARRGRRVARSSRSPLRGTGEAPVHLVGHAAESPEDNVGLSIRDALREGCAGTRLRRGLRERLRHRARRTRRGAVRRHVLPRGRARTPRALEGGREGHGARADRAAKSEASSASRPSAREDLHAREQHEPDPRRDDERRAMVGGRRMGDRVRRDGDPP